MELRVDSSVRNVLQAHPGTRAVFEEYGLAGCGGAAGPDEPIELFARAHGVPLPELMRDLRAAVGRPGGGVAEPVPPQPESYRHYLRAAVLVGMLAGAGLGAINLSWIAMWGYTGVMPAWDWWPALVQAHGNAQLFGWCGLFIMGVAAHSLPRMLQRPGPPVWLERSVFGLILTGVLLGLVSQPLTGRGGFGLVFALSAGLQAAGALLFGGWLLRLVGRPREPYLGFILAGALWFVIGALTHAVVSGVTVAGGHSTPPAAWNAAYLQMMTWGFLVCFVTGYSLRLLPTFLGLPTPRIGIAWAACATLNAATVTEVIARLAHAGWLSVLGALFGLGGAALVILALRVWSPVLAAGDADTAALARFVRTAFAWFAVAAVLTLGLRAAQAAYPVSLLHEHAFGGAARHALTVGFISLMLVGVASRILPIFSGAQRTPPAYLAQIYGVLLAGCALRVIGQIASGIWGGPWYAVMGVSGWLETYGISLFALDVLRLLNGSPDIAPFNDPGEEVEIGPEAPVGPLVAHRPWLVPVFARHGMAQVSSPVLQRTIGRRVTLAQACSRFQLEPDGFISELLAADADHARTCQA